MEGNTDQQPIFNVTILGCNASSFAHGRHQSSQLLRYDNTYILIDCGEGTQIRLLDFNLPLNSIDYVFISHLHIDHYQGLMGLLTRFSLERRTRPIFIYGPKGLDRIIDLQLSLGPKSFTYSYIFTEVEPNLPNHLLLKVAGIDVTSIPLQHGIPCTGFKFTESIEITPLGRLQRSYAYCSDTSYIPTLYTLLKGVTLLYHEATYDNAKEIKAGPANHSSARQAAMVAKEAEAGALLLGHFSSKFKDASNIERDAKAVFPNAEAAVEGKTYNI